MHSRQVYVRRLRSFPHNGERLALIIDRRPRPLRALCMRSAVLVTYRLATPSSTSTAQAMMASKIRSMVLN